MRMELKKGLSGSGFLRWDHSHTVLTEWQWQLPVFHQRNHTLCWRQAEPKLRFQSLNLVLNLVVRLARPHPLWKSPWPLLQFSAKKCVCSLCPWGYQTGVGGMDILVSPPCRECRTKSAKEWKENAHYWHLCLQPWLRLALTLEFCFLRKIPFGVKPIWASCRSFATQSSGRSEGSHGP